VHTFEAKGSTLLGQAWAIWARLLASAEGGEADE
jgi:hypothetical protein